MLKHSFEKLENFRNKLSKPVKIITTLIGVSIIFNPVKSIYPPITQFLLVIIPIIVVLWLWTVPFTKKDTKDK